MHFVRRPRNVLRDLRINKNPIFEREGWQSQPSLSKIGFLFSCKFLRIENKTKPGIFDAKRSSTALRIKNSGFYFICDPKYLEMSYKAEGNVSGSVVSG